VPDFRSIRSSFQGVVMGTCRFRLRTLMIAVAVVATTLTAWIGWSRRASYVRKAELNSRREIQYKEAYRRGNAVGTLNTGDLGLRTARLKKSLLEGGVLETVLIDLVSSREARSLYSGRNGTIVFGTARPGDLVSASDLIDREEPPSVLSAVQVQRTREAAKNAAWSQHERDFVESFLSSARRKGTSLGDQRVPAHRLRCDAVDRA
jgi:hypothetical protein